jgi:RHS repeat-associated protein
MRTRLGVVVVLLGLLVVAGGGSSVPGAFGADQGGVRDYSDLPPLPASAGVPVAVPDPQQGNTAHFDPPGMPKSPEELPEGATRDAGLSNANTDVYQFEGGDHIARVYPGVENYQASEGKWMPIDALLHDTEAGWSNGANSINLLFPRRLGVDSPFSFALGKGSYSTWFAGDGAAASVDGRLVDSDTVRYDGVLPGVDAVYDSLNTGTEERLVLSKPGSSVIVERFSSKDLSFKLDEDGVVRILAGSDEVGWIGPSVATDSSTPEEGGSPLTSTPSYKLDELGEGEYALSITLDQGFLAKATYPVMIDPARSVLTVDDTRDGWTEVDNPGTAHEGTSPLEVGPSAHQKHAFLSLSVSTYVHADRDVYTAQLNAYADAATSPRSNVGVRRVTAAWPSQPNLKWNNEPSAAGSTTDSVDGGAAGNWYQWDVKPIYQTIIDGTDDGHGVRLESASYHEFRSVEATGTSGDPFLYLFYNDRPDAPTQTQPVAGNPAISTPSPALKATIPNDPNGDDVYVRYQLCLQPTSAAYDCGVQSDFDAHVLSGSEWLDQNDTWVVPAGILKDGGNYYWRAQSAVGPEGGSGVWNPISGERFPTSVYRQFTITLPHLGSNENWGMWQTQAGNGVDIEVNPSSGNLYAEVPLETLTSPVGPLEMSLVYNSQDGKDFGMGRGWMPSIGSGVDPHEIPKELTVENSGESVAIRLRDGERLNFAKKSGITSVGLFQGSGAGAGTVRQTDDEWTWHTESGGQYVFDSDGNLSKANPNTTSFGKPGLSYTFNGSGQLTRVTDPLDVTTTNERRVKLAYDGSNRLSTIKDWVPTGAGGPNTWTVNYTGTATLPTSITDPLGKVIGLAYTTDSTTNSVKLLTGITDSGTTGSGHTWTIGYQQPPDAEVTYSQVASVTEPENQSGSGTNETTFAYESPWTGQLADSAVVADPRAAAATDAEYFQTHYDFNDQGLPIRVTLPKDSYGHVPIKTLLWDQNGNLVCQRSPGANWISMGCDTPSDPYDNDELSTASTYQTKPPYGLLSTKQPSPVWDGSVAGSTTSYEYDEDDTLVGLVQEDYPNGTFAGIPDYKIIDDATPANIDWGTGHPTFGGTSTPSNDFTVRWSGVIHVTGAPDGKWFRFRLGADDGSRLIVNGDVMGTCFARGAHAFDWTCGNGTQKIKMWNGDHDVLVEYHDISSTAQVDFEWDAGNSAGSMVNVPGSATQPDLHLLTQKEETSDTHPTLTTTYSYVSKVRGLVDATTETDASDATHPRVVNHPGGGSDYDENGRTLSEHTSDGSGNSYTVQTTYDAQKGCVTQVTDRAGAVTNTTCDTRGNLTQSSLVVPTTTSLASGNTEQPSQTRTTDTAYDQLGRVIKVSMPDESGGNPRMATITEYYPNGLVRATCVAPASEDTCDSGSDDQRVTEYTYDDSGRVDDEYQPAVNPTAGSPDQVVVHYEYDAAGNTTLERKTADGDDHDTISEYDGQNRATSVTTPAASDPTMTAYNDTGESDGDEGPVVTATDTSGIATVSRVDPLDRPTSAKTGTLPATTTSYGEQVASGFLGSKTIDEWGVYTKTTYTAWGEAKRITAPTGTSGAAKDLVYTFDKMGRATSVQDRNGNTTSYAYDGDGRLTQSSQTISGSAKVWQYVYDAAGERVEVKDPNARYREFTYDVNGRPVDTYEYRSDLAHSYQGREVGYQWTNTYNQFGDLEKTDDPLAGTLDFDPDHLGRIVHRQQTNPSGPPVGEETFTYDTWGRQTSAETDNGSGSDDLWITYDDADRTDQIKRGASLGAATTETDYDYLTTSGRLDSVTDLVGTTSYDYDPDTGQLDEVDDPLTASGQTTYTYDYISRTITRDDPAGLRTIRSLDQAGRPSDQKVVKISAPGTTLVDFTYGYDDDSNVTSANQTVGGGNTGSGAWSYAYDEAGRLTSQDPPGASNTTTYAYDGAGNRTSATFNTDPAVTTSYDGANHPIEQKQGTTQLQAYTYNDAGELTQTSINSGATVWDYTYDPWSRQTQAAKTTGATTTDLDYTYDALGRTLSRAKTGATTTTYSYQGLGEDVVKVTDAATTSYALLPSGPLAQKTGSTVRVIGRNLHGDVAYLADPTNQTITDTLTYNAWGEKTTTGADGAAEPLTFQADLTDQESNMVDMGTRIYDPTGGRFTTRDVVFGDQTNPQTLNQYIYGGDSPVVYFDPTGLYLACVTRCTAEQAHKMVQMSGTGTTAVTYGGSTPPVWVQRAAASPKPLPAPPPPSPDHFWRTIARDSVADTMGRLAGSTISKHSIYEVDPFGIGGSTLSSTRQLPRFGPAARLGLRAAGPAIVTYETVEDTFGGHNNSTEAQVSRAVVYGAAHGGALYLAGSATGACIGGAVLGTGGLAAPACVAGGAMLGYGLDWGFTKIGGWGLSKVGFD